MTGCWGCGSGTTPTSEAICGGRICLPFSLAWGLLTAAGLPPVQAVLAPALAAVPPPVTYAALLVFTADAVTSLRLLRQARDPAVLSLWGLLAA